MKIKTWVELYSNGRVKNKFFELDNVLHNSQGPSYLVFNLEGMLKYFFYNRYGEGFRIRGPLTKDFADGFVWKWTEETYWISTDTF